MAVRSWNRTFGQFVPSGPAPLVANANELFTPVPGSTLLRSLVNVDLYATATGTAGNVDLSFAFETLPTLGLILNNAATVPATSVTPQTDTNPISPWSDWLIWEHLYPKIDFVNVISPQFALATWRFKTGIIDLQTRRKTDATATPSLWMPWEVQNGSGLINTTTGGVTYALGARFSVAVLWET